MSQVLERSGGKQAVQQFGIPLIGWRGVSVAHTADADMVARSCAEEWCQSQDKSAQTFASIYAETIMQAKQFVNQQLRLLRSETDF